MSRKYDAKRVINGTYGEAWLDSDLLTEITALEIKIAFDKADINQCGQLMNGSKITGAKGTGTMTLNKVTSDMAVLVSSYLEKGQFPALTLISNLKDPDAFGAERVKVTGVTFDEVTLANWAAKTPGEQSFPFTFTGFKFLDKIK
ncbi:MAG: phage tail tube protein [Faecalibacterium sp.]|nr:phage tail tube protein [Ruminococcus sp.]MCM1392106.1 phage tail tube protein [Ruminococcus sp.]MCM1485803.1 phage tail tube protein [Faecalibacterium sp.]